MRNAHDAVALLQVAESGLEQIGELYARMHELAVQAASDSLSDTERAYLDTEFQDLDDRVDRVAESTEYNGIRVLNGESGAAFEAGISGPAISGYSTGSDFSSFTFHIGAREDTDNRLRVDVSGGIHVDVDALQIRNLSAAQDAITVLQRAINFNINGRVRLGSPMRRLVSAADHLAASIVDYAESISQIADTDLAEESGAFSREQVLQQARTAMLAQAHQQPNVTVGLLG